MNGLDEDTMGLPHYEPPPRFVPQNQRRGHPDYDNDLSQYLMRSVRFKRTNAPVSDDSSAQRVGMKPGDLILSVNGIDFSNVTLNEAVNILKQAEHLEVRLKYFPYGYEKTYLKE